MSLGGVTNLFNGVVQVGRRALFGNPNRPPPQRKPQSQPQSSPSSQIRREPVRDSEVELKPWSPQPALDPVSLPTGLAGLRHQWNSYWDYVVSRLWAQFSPSQMAHDALAAVSAAMGHFLPAFEPTKVENHQPPLVRKCVVDSHEEKYQDAYSAALATVLTGQPEACLALGERIARRLSKVEALYSPEQLEERVPRLLQAFTASANADIGTFITKFLKCIADYLQENLSEAIDGEMIPKPPTTKLDKLLQFPLVSVIEELNEHQDKVLGQLALKFLQDSPDLFEKHFRLFLTQLVGPKAIAAYFSQLIDRVDGNTSPKEEGQSHKHIRSKILTDEGSEAAEQIIRIILKDAMDREGFSWLFSLFGLQRDGVDKGLSLFFRKEEDKVVLNLTGIADKLVKKKGSDDATDASSTAADKLVEKEVSIDATDRVNKFFNQNSSELTGNWAKAEHANGFDGLRKLYYLFYDQPHFLENLLRQAIQTAIVHFFPISLE